MHQRLCAVADCYFTKFEGEREIEMNETTKTPSAHAEMAARYMSDDSSD